MKIRRVDFSPDEWIGGTVGLDNSERGLYITACALIYSHGGPVPIEELRAACRDHGHAFNRQINRLVALGKVTVNAGQIDNKRCANELQKARERHAKAEQNGRKGGRPNKKNNKIEKPAGCSDEKLTINHQPSTIKEDDANASSGTQKVSDGSKRGARLSPDWQPDDGDSAFARSLGLSPGEVTAEFRDYWIAVPGAKGCKLDWSATFRNRCRELAKRDRGGPQQRSGGSGSGYSRIAAALDRVHLAPDVSGPH